MKQIFDDSSFICSRTITKSYSTSFSLAVRLLSRTIRNAIYSIYGFVRFADEIVDTFHHQDQEKLIQEFEDEFYRSKQRGLSMNPILHSFLLTVEEYNIPNHLIQSFLKSMKMDLVKSNYSTEKEYDEYIYGSADVVGLMCLCVFVRGDKAKYEELKHYAMKLGSAFQKVNFLRDIDNDLNDLNRSYFPNVNFKTLTEVQKAEIIDQIEGDFKYALTGILKLPVESKLGVYVAYVYYKRLLAKLRKVPTAELMKNRVRISNPGKIGLLARSLLSYKLKTI